MFSRTFQTIIKSSTWELCDSLFWLTVTTDVTGSREFRIVGTETVTDHLREQYKQYDVLSVVTLGELAAVPVASCIVAGIAPGHNIAIGILNDGMNDLCGDLVFARYYNKTRGGNLATNEMMAHARRAAEIFSVKGKTQATNYLNSSDLFSEIFEDSMIERPHKNDSSVWEFRPRGTVLSGDPTLKRLRWKNDRPASEKQIDYVYSLLNHAQSLAPAERLTEYGSAKYFAAVFWKNAELPADLTFTEATKLIDDLQHAESYTGNLPDAMLETIIKRLDGQKVSSGVPWIMFTSVFCAACEPLIQWIKDRGAVGIK